jgi:hypothetical protein
VCSFFIVLFRFARIEKWEGLIAFRVSRRDRGDDLPSSAQERHLFLEQIAPSWW